MCFHQLLPFPELIHDSKLFKPTALFGFINTIILCLERKRCAVLEAAISRNIGINSIDFDLMMPEHPMLEAICFRYVIMSC